MTRNRGWIFAIALAISVGSMTNGAFAATELIENGGFETGDFQFWTVTDLPGGDGSWFVSTPGATTPISNSATSAVGSSGSFYAVTDQNGPGSHSLTQSFTVPVGTLSAILSFSYFANDSDSGPIVDPDGLTDITDPNQHTRVDLLTGTAGPFDTGPSEVLANFYLGVDDQMTNPNPFTPYSFDITALVSGGGTFQIRFAEVDNQFFLNAGVDNVSVLVDFSPPVGVVPEPASLLVWSMLSMVAMATRLKSRRSRQ